MTYEIRRRRIGDGIHERDIPAAEDLNAREVVCLGPNGWLRADADDATRRPAIGITMAEMGIGQFAKVLLQGTIGDSSWTWAPGGTLYLSATAGAITQVAPAITQELGEAIEADLIYFNPQGVQAGITGITIRLNSGADIGTRPRLNFIEGSATYLDIQAVDDAVGNEVDITVTSEGIGARERPAAIQGPRRVINLIEGALVTITVADNAGNQEVDVTIGAAVQSGFQDVFYEAPNPDDFKGRYASMLLTDGVSTLIKQSFYLPNNYTALWSVDVIVIPDGTGNLRWGVNTNFGAICSNEQFDAHSDTIALGQIAVTDGEIECIDITAALTGALAGDLVGIEFTRDGGNALDTVNDEVHYIGVVLRASAPV